MEYLIFILLPLVDYHVVECTKEKALIPEWINRRYQRVHQALEFRQKNDTGKHLCFPLCLPIAVSPFRPSMMFLIAYLLTEAVYYLFQPPKLRPIDTPSVDLCMSMCKCSQHNLSFGLCEIYTMNSTVPNNQPLEPKHFWWNTN